MALPERNPHDALYKAVFARPENALALLRSGLPTEVVDLLDPTSLELETTTFVDDDLREQRSDLLFRARLRSNGQEVFVHVLIEHQRKQEPFMVLRVLGYLVRIWEEWRRLHPDARRLPVIVPLVLHQGPSPWTQARSMAELYDAPPDVVDVLGSLVPVLDLALDDLGEQSVEGASASGAPVLARLARGLLRAMADPRLDPGQVFESLGELLRELIGQPGGPADLRLLVLYTVLVRPGIDVTDLGERVRRVAGPEAKEVVMSTAQQLIEQGIEQGQVLAVRRMLKRQLGARFGTLPASVLARIEKASVDEIDAWGLRILEAKEMEDVFRAR
jgi:hypothetical protein